MLYKKHSVLPEYVQLDLCRDMAPYIGEDCTPSGPMGPVREGPLSRGRNSVGRVKVWGPAAALPRWPGAGCLATVLFPCVK